MNLDSNLVMLLMTMNTKDLMDLGVFKLILYLLEIGTLLVLEVKHFSENVLVLLVLIITQIKLVPEVVLVLCVLLILVFFLNILLVLLLNTKLLTLLLILLNLP